jgi:Spy/CpxP family protein refolding chaperone
MTRVAKIWFALFALAALVLAVVDPAIVSSGYAQDRPPPKPAPAKPAKPNKPNKPDKPAAPPEAKPEEAEKPLTAAQQRAAERRRALLQKRVGLDEQKAAEVVAIVQKHTAAQRQVRQKVRDARKRMRELLRTDSNDEQAYASALSDLEAAHSALNELRQKRFEELEQVLTAREQAKLLTTMGKVRRELARGKQRDDADKPPRRRRNRIFDER